MPKVNELTMNLDELLAGCSLTVGRYGTPLTGGGDGPALTHFYHVLTPPDWPEPAGMRWRTAQPDGLRWFEGSASSEAAARVAACDVLGRCWGARVASFMGGRTIPAQVIPPANTLTT